MEGRYLRRNQDFGNVIFCDIFFLITEMIVKVDKFCNFDEKISSTSKNIHSAGNNKLPRNIQKAHSDHNHLLLAFLRPPTNQKMQQNCDFRAQKPKF